MWENNLLALMGGGEESRASSLWVLFCVGETVCTAEGETIGECPIYSGIFGISVVEV